jgi:hypothetical protein
MKAARILEVATKNNILAVLFQFPSWLPLFGGVKVCCIWRIYCNLCCEGMDWIVVASDAVRCIHGVLNIHLGSVGV